MSQQTHVITNPGFAGAWVLGAFPNSLFLWQPKRPPWLHRRVLGYLGIHWHDGPSLTFITTVLDHPCAQPASPPPVPEPTLKPSRFIQ